MPERVSVPKPATIIIIKATEALALQLFLVVALGLHFSSASSKLFLKILDLR